MNGILNGRYRIDGTVGEGGMAIVYRGTDTALNRVVAIKVLREQYAKNAQFLARFHREAQAAAGLTHPNIVNVYDVGRDGDTWYIVQELIDGTDLATLIHQRAPFTVPQATEIMAQILSALDYAHARGLIHRDVKPHNILIDSRGTAKVADFGIAKGVNDVTMTDAGTALGTAGYISPEQATGGTLTATSDLYSAGVVLYEMLTGRLPFVGDTAVSVAMQHVRNPPPPPTRYNPKIGRAMEAVILRAMEKLPDRRYPSGDQFIAALRASMTASPTQAATVASGAGAATVSLAETTRAMPATDGPRLRAGVADTARSGTRRVEATPMPPVTRRSAGPGIATWLIGIVLLGGILALVFFGYQLFNATNGGGKPDATGTALARAATVSPTAPTAAASPTVAPTVVGPTATVDPNLVLVPNLSGSTLPQAAQSLKDHSIPLGIGKELPPRLSDTIPRGQIVFQMPSPGAKVPKNSQIDVAYSLGPATTDVGALDLKGKPYDEAAQILKDAGLNPDRKDEMSDTIPMNAVTRTDPVNGTLRNGSTIAVYVSMGKPTPTAMATATPGPTATVAASPTATGAAATPTVTPNPMPATRAMPTQPMTGGTATLPSVAGDNPQLAQRAFQQAGFTNVTLKAVPSNVVPGAKKGVVAAVANGNNGQILQSGQQYPKDTPIEIIYVE